MASTLYDSLEEFNYWFVPVHRSYFSVYDVLTGELIGHISDISNKGPTIQLEAEEDYTYNNVTVDFDKFKEFPEYFVGTFRFDIEGTCYMEQNRDDYKKLLRGICRLRAFSNRPKDLLGVVPKADEKVNNILDWLDRTDFFRAPASTVFHESYAGGLVHHSLTVFELINNMYLLDKFSQVSLLSFGLVALIHDWCKINIYESYKRNVKNEITGMWEAADAYRRVDSDTPFGHGAESFFLAQRCFRLTLDEALAIRWHMGVWNLCEGERNDYSKACKTHPLVYMLQFADQLSIVNY